VLRGLPPASLVPDRQPERLEAATAICRPFDADVQAVPSGTLAERAELKPWPSARAAISQSVTGCRPSAELKRTGPPLDTTPAERRGQAVTGDSRLPASRRFSCSGESIGTC
jgi:hypothetical protein